MDGGILDTSNLSATMRHMSGPPFTVLGSLPHFCSVLPTRFFCQRKSVLEEACHLGILAIVCMGHHPKCLEDSDICRSVRLLLEYVRVQ
jgi:hypothetical protein